MSLLNSDYFFLNMKTGESVVERLSKLNLQLFSLDSTFIKDSMDLKTLKLSSFYNFRDRERVIKQFFF